MLAELCEIYVLDFCDYLGAALKTPTLQENLLTCLILFSGEGFEPLNT